MIIESVKLDQFRNYEKLDLVLSEGTNLFYGDNAQGKTNVLEAVYLCGSARSHRMAKDREMIRFGQDEAHLRMQLVKKTVSYRIDIHLKKGRAKSIAVNGAAIRRASELIGLGNFVFFSPEDLNLIKAGPDLRRRFMDMELCQLQRVYVNSLNGYQKALQQRNALLKDISVYHDAVSMLDIWDEQLISYGSRIIEEREKFIHELSILVKDIHCRLSGEREILEVKYVPSVSQDRYTDVLKEQRAKDIRMKTTSAGPHRDDLQFVCNGADLRRFGSQGQQRTCALSVKLAEIELVKRASGDSPVLLLDDVLSELDRNRQHLLLESIEKTQTLITGTGVDDFVSNEFHIDRLFQVRQGTVSFCEQNEM